MGAKSAARKPRRHRRLRPAAPTSRTRSSKGRILARGRVPLRHLFKLPPDNRGASKWALVADFRRVARKLRVKRLSQSQYEEAGGRYSRTMVQDRFGCWSQAAWQAGLLPQSLHLDKETLLENLHRIWMSLGRAPAGHDMRPPKSIVSETPYVTAFGSWRKALEAFTRWVNLPRNRRRTLQALAEVGDAELLRRLDGGRQKRQRARRARSINVKWRFEVMRRDRFRCRACGRSPAADPAVKLHVDHIKPFSKGGGNELTNLQTLCSKCNRGKATSHARVRGG